MNTRWYIKMDLKIYFEAYNGSFIHNMVRLVDWIRTGKVSTYCHVGIMVDNHLMYEMGPNGMVMTCSHVNSTISSYDFIDIDVSHSVYNNVIYGIQLLVNSNLRISLLEVLKYLLNRRCNVCTSTTMSLIGYEPYPLTPDELYEFIVNEIQTVPSRDSSGCNTDKCFLVATDESISAEQDKE